MLHYAYNYFTGEDMGKKVTEIGQIVQLVSGRVRLPNTQIHTCAHTRDRHLNIHCY